MTTLTPAQVRRKTLISGTVGAIVEWYEYTVYATAAALVFGDVFFPDLAPGASQIAALASFGVGFAARPAGAYVAGLLGDRLGRKSTLVLTFSIMSAATALIGILPSYAQIGIWAPILLSVLRLAQGFAVGGEWGGAAVIAVENAPNNRRGLFGSWPQIGVSSGLLLGTAAVSAASALSGDQFAVWGWRLPFLFAVVLAGVGMWIRLSATESPAFLEAKKQLDEDTSTRKAPLTELVRSHRRSLLIAIFARCAEAGNYYLLTVFVLSYVSTTLDVPRQYGLTAVLVGSAANIVAIPVFGRLSDTFGRKKVFLFGAAFIIVTAWPVFALIETGALWAITLGVVLFLALGHAAVYAPLPAFYCELFPTMVRYSGISIGYQVMAIILAGFTPSVAAWLVLASGGSTWPLILMVVVSTAVAVVAMLFASETKDVDLSAGDARPSQARQDRQTPAGASNG
ncbi:MFS transporter [Streptomyces sp. LHD-70]|uniref:MFS transporter n=1 Tax=Streptomyces sp. LHD-70 TaxID=3072140 RepID=UPI00280D4AE8|nr:MFS transporter [Streptomyces sp. LHD-70]MDQ8708221.1 MFS transporter [Streptomyces sp. LHD-70]